METSMDHSKDLSNLERIPITLVTCYLGSGKTSLLKHILDRSKKKIAIIMNEFGDIAIDSKVIKGKNVEIAELSGGCVCCSMTGEFEAAVKEIIELAKPEWIILETTGVAEPSSLVFEIGNDLNQVRLDAIVTIVDADAMLRFPQLGHTGKEQIQIADIIILNKIDLVDEYQIQDVIAKIQEINPNPRIIIAKAIRSKVPPEFLFGLNRDHIMQEHKKHNNETEVFVFEEDIHLNKEKLVKFLEHLPKEIYRAKGFIKCENKETYLLNYVAGRFELEPFAAKSTELVFIGKDVLKHETEVKKALQKCKLTK